MLKNGLYYIYTEYCPGDFFWGWWLYAAPMVDEKPDRTKSTWLNGDVWLDRLHRAINLPEMHTYRGHNHTIYTHRFLEHYPNGLLLNVQDFYTWVHVAEPAPLWEYSRHVREQQLLDWKKVMKEK